MTGAGTADGDARSARVTPVTVIPGVAGEPPVGTAPSPSTDARPQLANTGHRDLAAAVTGLTLVARGPGPIVAGRRRRT